ncbi:MAG TPA: alpha/beta hydrolase [Pseudomonadales bacterium]|nr:alpha/beta hydrolase [Pseudomonadales bacterium]
MRQAIVAEADQPVPAPNLFYTLAEGYRAVLEACTGVGLGPVLRALPRGDGHPVLVLPGFMASDQSTGLLRRQLERLGYRTHPWTFGRNLGPRGDLVERMVRRAREISDVHGGRLSIVGQSLGGIYAREIARLIPERVRQVITLGSPFGALDGGGTNSGVSRLFEISTGKTRAQLREEELFSDLRSPPSVPCTAVFSRTDGIAHWQVCLERDLPHTDNVEIMGSHCGMAFNPVVLWVLADRLAQAEGAWRRFERGGMRSYVFPDPVFALPAA